MRILKLLLLVPLAFALACGDGGEDIDLTDGGTADAGCAAPCGSVCCPAGQSCSGGVCRPQVCTPNCSGKVCGDDGCGGSCGDCSTGKSCNADGLCEQCVPKCQGKDCGSDGCGGQCGQCPSGSSCQGNTCQSCTPNCAGKSCGSDGCGGECGSCGSGVCDNGGCVECKADTDCAGKALSKCDTASKRCVGCRTNFDCDPGGNVICSPNTKTCIVECTTDAQCAAVAGLPRCNRDSGLCVACLTDTHCASYATTRSCDTDTNTCVVCADDSDCRTAGRTACKDRVECVQCTNDFHCGGDDICDLTTNRCVECVGHGDCFGGFCNSNQQCVECLSANDCSGSTKACAAGRCVECASSADCAGNAEARACDLTSNTCVACLNDGHCASYPGMKRCIAASNTCVECTAATQETDCRSKLCLSDNTCEPPSADNDTCATATTVDLSNGVFSATIDTTIARDEYQANCATDGREVVYLLELGPGQRVRVEATGQGNVKPVLYVRENCTSNSSFDEVACNAATSNKATLELTANAFRDYYVLVGDGGTGGTIELKVTSSPTNDTCSAPAQLNLASGSATATGSTTLANDDHSAPVGFSGKDVVYSFNHFSGAKTFKATLTPTGGSQATHVLVLKSGSCTSFTNIDYEFASGAGLPVTLEIPNLANGTYYLWVDGLNSTGGDFDLNVTLGASGPETNCNNALDDDGDGKIDCADSDCANAPNCQATGNGDTCASPITATLVNNEFRATGTTFGAANDATSARCAGATGPDKVYRITTTQPHDFIARVDPVDPDFTTYRPILYMRRASCASTSATDELICDDAGFAGDSAFIRQTNLPAGTYYLWVDGAAGTSGDYNLLVFTGSELPMIDGADTCATAGPAIDAIDGASWNGTLAGKADNLSSTCSAAGGPDVHYDVTLPMGYPFVYIQVTTNTPGFQPVVESRSVCTTATTSCAPNATVPVPVLGFRMPADYDTTAYGTLLVIDSKAGSGQFTVDVWGSFQ